MFSALTAFAAALARCFFKMPCKYCIASVPMVGRKKGERERKEDKIEKRKVKKQKTITINFKIN